MKKFTFLSLLPTFLFAETLSIDPYLSPYMGADAVISATEYLIQKEDSFQIEGEGLWEQIGGGIYRLSSTSLFWTPYSFYINTLQHEFFGHGFRIRSLHKEGFESYGYKVSLPPPYGTGGGYAKFGRTESAPLLGRTLIALGGTEAQTVLAMKLRTHFFERGVIDGRVAGVYDIAQLGLLLYAATCDEIVKSGENPEAGLDITDYIKTFNEISPNQLSTDKIVEICTIAVLDPFLWNSVISSFSYLIWGTAWNFPVFELGPIRFLYAISPNLTPHGVEMIYQQYYSLYTTPFESYFRYTDAEHPAMGGGLKCLDLFQVGNFHFGGALDGWIEPILLADRTEDSLQNFRLGGQFLVSVKSPLIKDESRSFGIEFGYKTEGYLIGTPYASGVVARANFSFEF